jgi:hypothetical protein
VREVALEAARRAVVARQTLATRRRTAKPDEVEAAIDRLGCVQLDAISTVDRSQRLVLSARTGRIDQSLLNGLLAEGRVFEYWAHEACLIPAADWRFLRIRMRCGSHHQWYGRIFDEHPQLVEQVLATVRERGPVSARDFGGAGSGYWEWSPAKRVVEALWTSGQLVVAHRRGVERRYDLPERVLPREVLEAPEPAPGERRRHFLLRAVRARALVREARVHDYYRFRGGLARLRPAIDALVAEGVLERARLRESGDVALVESDAAERIAEGSQRPTGAFLLSPFDNVLWDRIEARALFGFEHALEIYKRPHERVWGYYVLPLVDGPAIVGRVDAKADRQAGVLRALQVHWQGRPRPRALREALARLAWLLGLPETEVPGGVRDASAARWAGS